MKYEKQQVVDLIETEIEKIKETEKKNLEKELETHQRNIIRQEEARKSLKEFSKELALQLNSKHVDYESVANLFNHYLDDKELRYSRSEYQKIKYAKTIHVKPTLNTDASDRLKRTLQVFETGTPPQVGVQDLKAFGLLDLVKYTS